MDVSAGPGTAPKQTLSAPRRRYWVYLALFAMTLINYTAFLLTGLVLLAGALILLTMVRGGIGDAEALA